MKAIKLNTADLHAQVEGVNPLSMLLQGYIEDARQNINEFEKGVFALWAFVLRHPEKHPFHTELSEVFSVLYPNAALNYVDCTIEESLGMTYVVLGSSMGSVFIAKRLQELLGESPRYFVHMQKLIPLFLRFKAFLEMFEGDENIQNKITSGARSGFELLINQWSEKPNTNRQAS